MTYKPRHCLRSLRRCRFWRTLFFWGPCRLTIKSFIFFLGLAACSVVISFYSFPFFHLNGVGVRSGVDEKDGECDIEVDLSQNYFQSRKDLESRGFLVDTPKCRIPDVDLWNAQVRELVNPPRNFNYSEKLLKLTYVEKETVVINEKALKSAGYILEEIHCCYHTVKRIDQFRESFNQSADNLFRISDECELMERITKPKYHFIKVICKSLGFSNNPSVNYTNFHIIAMFPNDPDSGLGRKLRWWQNCLSISNTSFHKKLCSRFRHQGRPPNVLLLGWDSTSRANFHRFMPKTKDLLQNKLGAVEMVGYNKVGINTFPNFVPLVTSHSAEELQKLCHFNKSVPLDDCPFLWKRFSDHHYLTGFLEDAPRISIFNYLRTGFLHSPTDIYLRPLMLAAYHHQQGPRYIDCMGYQRPEEVILNYLVDLANLSESRGIPYLLSVWLTDLTHDALNNLQTADKLMAGTLELLDNAGLLENTVLILISDHGYRFLKIRTTVTGWLEDNLPTLWIKLPPTLVKRRVSWMEALRDNSHNLVTPFDVFEVLQDTLNLFWKPRSPRKKNGRDLRGISFFKKIPARSCQEAGVPSGYCACDTPTACDLNSTLIKMAAQYALDHINSRLAAGCTPLYGAAVSACGVVTKMMPNDTGGDDGGNSSKKLDVVIAFSTKPGNFLLEAVVNYDPAVGRCSGVTQITRMNHLTSSLECLGAPRDGVTELFCYCDLTTK